jgi:hypothetical protein
LIKEYKNSSSKSVYLLNNKYKYRRFIEYWLIKAMRNLLFERLTVWTIIFC